MDASLPALAPRHRLRSGRSNMPDTERSRLNAVLAELCQAVGADGGGAVYLDDGDGTLQLAATSSSERSGSIINRLKSLGSWEDTGKTLIMRLGGTSGGMVVLNRKGSGEFTQQDRAVARLYAWRFTDEGIVDQSPIGKSGWTRQLEAIQHIAARLTRLASGEEVPAAIGTRLREGIGHHEA